MSSYDVIWSGYQIDVPSFKNFMMKLRGQGDFPPPDDKRSVIKWSSDYIRWRRNLPPRTGAKVPRIRYIPSSPQHAHGEDITHIFFPIRWIPYKSEHQLNDPSHPDYAKSHEPTETDKAKLDRWLNYINENNGGEYRVNSNMFEFGTILDLHPVHEWRSVSCA
ncbi:hypothetical protein J3R30DRAFT_3700468 [Lentinula aciculospora]|uniref:Uncharacterized protein n=1 Tax=Lentinula aciculospora TaxID=153920 RepID=A0A9W9AEJ5_9AGAR|nr:hypothetical protein J3R30DRAFT_3700468 [Lentinula aciculospora]